jgi:hypothetical protein
LFGISICQGWTTDSVKAILCAVADFVTVFVDDAVMGRLPPVCLKDGVYTQDLLCHKQVIGDEGLGLAWLLVFLGPFGWIGLFFFAVLRRPGEVLAVELPFSDAAYERLVAARRHRRSAVVMTSVAAALLVGTVLLPTGPIPLGWLLAVVAAAALAAGLVRVVVTGRRLRDGSVVLELDASRRWVTLFGVHPAFAAAARDNQNRYDRLP